MYKTEEMDRILSKMRKSCGRLSDDYKKIKDILNASEIDHLDYYYILSFWLQVSGDAEAYKLLLKYSIQDESITKETKFFLYNQYVRYRFLHSDLIDEEMEELFDELYDHILKCYLDDLNKDLSYISKEERNPDFVIVLATQVLGMGHGPTKTLLDRCSILVKNMNKNVYIVNTVELLNGYQAIPFFHACTANCIDAFNSLDYLSYKGMNFPFLQCPAQMPQSSVISEILEIVKSEKPYFIVTIGGNSIVSDICSSIVPVLSVGTVPSERVQTRGKFQTIGRKITEKDKCWLEKHHLPKEHMIESIFTFSFKEQTHTYTRKQLRIPEKQFAVAVVGGRLDEEIDAAFSVVLKRLMEENIFIVFIGTFDRYPDFVEKTECFERNSVYLGFQEDVLAVYECCDLYMNPRRVGGGTSAAEVLFKGLPVVTLPFGDVGASVGENFHVSSYEEMCQETLRYAADKEYYEQKSKEAKARAERLMDSKSEFCRIIRQIEDSEIF